MYSDAQRFEIQEEFETKFEQEQRTVGMQWTEDRAHTTLSESRKITGVIGAKSQI